MYYNVVHAHGNKHRGITMRKDSVISVSLPKKLRKKLDEQARLEYRNRSELIREALRQYLWRKRFEKLSIKLMEARPDLKPDDIEELVGKIRSEKRSN